MGLRREIIQKAHVWNKPGQRNLIYYFGTGTPEKSPFEGGAPTKEGWGMFARLAGNLLLGRRNIPLRRSASAARRCPPSKGELQ